MECDVKGMEGCGGGLRDVRVQVCGGRWNAEGTGAKGRWEVGSGE